MMLDVAQNWHELNALVARAAQGRKVTIVGAAKDQPVERVRAAIAAGLEIVAMNYAQQGEALREALRDLPVQWHFIGHIQSRKVKLLTWYDCIQSLDRLEIAAAFHHRLQGMERGISALVEVNIGNEPQKSGIAAAGLEAFLAGMEAYPRVKVIGLMGMPPPLQPPEARRPYFQRLRELFDAHRDRYGLTQLSMGTSDDFLVAVQEGATMIRIGTALFGSR